MSATHTCPRVAYVALLYVRMRMRVVLVVGPLYPRVGRLLWRAWTAPAALLLHALSLLLRLLRPRVAMALVFSGRDPTCLKVWGGRPLLRVARSIETPALARPIVGFRLPLVPSPPWRPGCQRLVAVRGPLTIAVLLTYCSPSTTRRSGSLRDALPRLLTQCAAGSISTALSFRTSSRCRALTLIDTSFVP